MANIIQLAFSFSVGNTVSPWLRVEDYEGPFNASLLISQDVGASLTLALRYVVDDGSNAMKRQVLISQTTTVITVQDSGPPIQAVWGGNLGHGLAVGDMVTLEDQAGVSGTYNVATVVDATHYTVTSAVSQSLAAHIGQGMTGKSILAGSAGDKIIGATGAGITVTTSLPLNQPVWALQLFASTITTPGVARLTMVQASSR